MTKIYRNNCYGLQVNPRHPEQINDLSLFWPTDSEFKIIFNTTFGRAHYDQLRQAVGAENSTRLRKSVKSSDYYLWFLENLQNYTKGYTVPLSEEIVLSSLSDWIEQKAKPWLASQNENPE